MWLQDPNQRRFEGNMKIDLQYVGWDINLMTGSGSGQVAGDCECGNEDFGFHKMWGTF
jgi:hypothetical protein